MTRKTLFLAYISVIIGLSILSCKKDDPDIDEGEELITTLTYQLTPQNGGDAVVLSFQDLDGDGGNAPVVSGGTLAVNTTYTGTVKVENGSVDPVENITEEVEAEAEEHQFFYVPSNLNLTVDYTDTDADDNPIGIGTTLTTGEASTGTLKVVLRHEPNKSADGVNQGNIGNAGGETDIEVDFDIVIE